MTPPKTGADLFDLLNALDVQHRTYHHSPVFRVKDGLDVKAEMPGAHTKNLFLKDARGQLWLVCALGETGINLKVLPKQIGSARLSFGSEERLWNALGVRPGSVTAFALINDDRHAVNLIIDQALLKYDLVNFHPLSNDATTAISRTDFLKFLTAIHVNPTVIDFSAPA